PVLSSSILPTLTPPTQLHTLSLHDALPICSSSARCSPTPPLTRSSFPFPTTTASAWSSATSPPSATERPSCCPHPASTRWRRCRDRKSTRLNSSHVSISYAVFCLTKKTPTD